MSIKVLNSQGTKIYVADVPATEWTDCTAAINGIKAGKLVGCPQSIGDLTETRTVTEYKCLSSNESAKALGSISRGSLEIGLLLDPNDTAGQGALKEAFANNTQVVVGLELPDGTSGGNGTLYWFKAGVSAVSTGIQQDAAISYKVTLEISSAMKECKSNTVGSSVPDAPTNLTTGTATQTGTDIGWDAPAGGGTVDTYQVNVYTTGTTTDVGNSPYTVQAGTTTQAVDGLTAGTSYDIAVTANNAAGSSSALTGTVTTAS